MKRLLHRDSAPILSFSSFGAKRSEERRKSEAALQTQAPPPPPPSLPSVQTVSLPRFYVKGINREGAEEILEKQPIGVFLVRDRETSISPGSYTLSLRHRVGLKHHKIDTHSTTCKLVIAGYERFQFDTLEQLTDFFIKSQKRDIALVPYDPDEVSSTVMTSTKIEQPAYEEMEGTDEQDHNDGDMYLNMEEGHLPTDHGTHSSKNGDGPPPLPHRGRNDHHDLPYENLTRPQKDVPGKCPGSQNHNSYENIPEKGSSSAPPIPPRIPPSSQSYENMHGKAQTMPTHPRSYENTPPKQTPPRRTSYQNVLDRESPGLHLSSYQNVPDRPGHGAPPLPRRSHAHGPGYENYNSKPTGYENYFSQTKQQSNQQPGHSYQNLPPKVAPRRSPAQANMSAEHHLPPRKPVPIRRVKTDSQIDFNARRP